MFHRDNRTPKRVESTKSFDESWGDWISAEILSRVFDISSQTEQKLRSKR